MAVPSNEGITTSFPQAIEDCFTLGTKNNLRPDERKACIAQLSQDQIMVLFNNSGYPRAQVLSKELLISSGGAEVYYNIGMDPSVSPQLLMDLRISHLSSVRDGQLAMKSDLFSIDQMLETAVKRTELPYGNCSLQTTNSLFWWHLRHLISITMLGDTSDLKAARAFANTLNQHLVMSEVDQAQLEYPRSSILGSSTVTIPQGTTRTLQLNNLDNTDDVKRVSVDTPGILIVTQTPTKDGKVPIFGQRPGTVQLTVLVAHDAYLTVKPVVFTVTVSDDATSGG